MIVVCIFSDRFARLRHLSTRSKDAWEVTLVGGKEGKEKMAKLTRGEARRPAPRPGRAEGEGGWERRVPLGQSGWAGSQAPNTSLQALVPPSGSSNLLSSPEVCTGPAGSLTGSQLPSLCSV